MAEVDTLLGGRAAEEVFIKEISTGASNDLERATDIIKSMVRMYGMSDVAGLMVLEKQSSQFLGGGISQKDYSEEMAQQTDNYIKELLNERYKEVKFKLKEYSEVIENMVKDLQEKEVISGERVRELIKEFKEGKLENKEEKNEEN